MARKAQAGQQERVWRDRIVGEGMVPPAELAPHPLNPRTHPAAQARALEGLLAEVGWVQRVVVNKRTGRLVDGHLRVEVARARGEPTVPVVYVDLTEPEESLVLALLDPIAGLATLNREALATLVDGLDVEDEALAALARTLGGTPGGRGDPDAVPEVPSEPAPWVKRGAVYRLGRHRLMCGDSTSAEDVARLLDGAKPALMVTDPPYGVEYEGGTKKREGLAADGHGTDIYATFLPVASTFLDPKAAVYLWHADRASMPVLKAIESSGYVVRAQIVWNKNLAQFGALTAQYKPKHEPCFYAHRKGNAPYWYGPKNEVTVWDFDRAAANDFHPTQKPVEMFERVIRNSSKSDDVVFDAFSGSGTTIIAAERQSRACYAMEIEPRYVQVAVERWEAYTGQQATDEAGKPLRRALRASRQRAESRE